MKTKIKLERERDRARKGEKGKKEQKKKKSASIIFLPFYSRYLNVSLYIKKRGIFHHTHSHTLEHNIIDIFCVPDDMGVYIYKSSSFSDGR